MSVDLKQLRLGCAGWSYKEWVGPLYDSEKKMLQQYGTVFDTVELNASFYRPPTARTILGLTRYTRRGFMFSAKLNQKFTHQLRLLLDEQSEAELMEFIQLFDPLLSQDRFGCFLIQLPPSLKRDHGLLEGFLAALPNRYDYVVEFRHPTWMDDSTWVLLSKYEVGYCIVDEPLLPPELHVTSSIGYIRWHGHGERLWYDYRYSEQQLRDWIPKIKEVAKNATTTFGIFNNHFHGYAPENCIQTMQLLGLSQPMQEKTLSRLRMSIEQEQKGLPHTGTLDQYTISQESG